MSSPESIPSASDFESATVSLIGGRKLNQDRTRVITSDDSVLIVLADGLGGHPKGEVAAQILVDTSIDLFHQTAHPADSARALLEEILVETHHRITDFGTNQEPPILPRSTAVIALIHDDMAWWTYVGDSRLYVIRDGKVLERTKDHSYVQMLHEEGIISHAEMSHHPQRNYITRCLGGSVWPPQASFGQISRLQKNDILLACSDGFWEHLDDSQLGETISREVDLDKCLRELALTAVDLGGPHSDNVTAAAVRCGYNRPTSSNDIESDLDDAIDALQQAMARLGRTPPSQESS